ncbi:sensor histidine kinase [Cryptosporangium arvum]|uniref:sensor histidine kinase n=1 Tax=Cryptosporangium arvum TaxID=80871 RepID=UPI0004B6F330|nr:histidine kinase [Cryptosporangium arvum]
MTDDNWVVLAAAGNPARADRVVSWRRIIVQSVLAVLVVFGVAASAGTIAARQAAESESVNDALTVTDLLAGAVVTPALEDALLSPDRTTAAAARERLDAVIRPGVLVGAIVRTKIWTPDGTIVYSDEPRLIGRTFPLGDDERGVLETPRTRADVSDLDEPENQYERSDSKLLEVYRPVWTPGGRTLLFETYSRYDAVTDRSGQLWRGFASITVSSLLLMLVLQAPVIWALVGRVRRATLQREQLRERAMAASDSERKRIAATLHDGVVQDLTAGAFAVAAAAGKARATPGAESLAERLDSVAGTVRAGVGSMRSLLVDIYPPSLVDSGLAAALEDLVTGLRERGTEVEITVEPTRELTPDVESLLFRVAQESLRNVAKHADAAHVVVAVTGAVTLEVADDGVGFDPAAVGPEGHFGLRVMADLAREAGATLAVASRPGGGTRWRLEKKP